MRATSASPSVIVLGRAMRVVEQALRLLAEVIAYADLLAGDLVASGGVRPLDFACLRQHLVDLAARDDQSAGGVGEHVRAGHHSDAPEDNWHVCLKRRHAVASPASRLPRAVG